MSDSPPTPPAHLSTEFIEELEGSDPEQLTRVADFATALADYKRATAESQAADSPESDEQDVEDQPTGVPAKASITVKEINGNRYEYWQWREGESIKSKYKGPAGGDT